MMLFYTDGSEKNDLVKIPLFQKKTDTLLFIEFQIFFWSSDMTKSLNFILTNELLSILIFWGTSLLVQWLRLCAPNAGDSGSIPGQGNRARVLQLKILRATCYTCLFGAAK